MAMGLNFCWLALLSVVMATEAIMTVNTGFRTHHSLGAVQVLSSAKSECGTTKCSGSMALYVVPEISFNSFKSISHG